MTGLQRQALVQLAATCVLAAKAAHERGLDYNESCKQTAFMLAELVDMFPEGERREAHAIIGKSIEAMGGLPYVEFSLN